MKLHVMKLTDQVAWHEIAGHKFVYCCNTETEDRVRVYQFMCDLIACRDGTTETVAVFYQEMKCVMFSNFLAVN